MRRDFALVVVLLVLVAVRFFVAFVRKPALRVRPALSPPATGAAFETFVIVTSSSVPLVVEWMGVEV